MHYIISMEVLDQTLHVICAQINTIKLFEFYTFYDFLDCFTHTKQSNKVRLTKTMHINKCKMQKMHEDMTFNA